MEYQSGRTPSPTHNTHLTHFDYVTATRATIFSKGAMSCLDESHLQQQDDLLQDNKHALKDCRHPAAQGWLNEWMNEWGMER